jgi:hypothetical protein
MLCKKRPQNIPGNNDINSRRLTKIILPKDVVLE